MADTARDPDKSQICRMVWQAWTQKEQCTGEHYRIPLAFGGWIIPLGLFKLLTDWPRPTHIMEAASFPECTASNMTHPKTTLTKMFDETSGHPVAT